MSPRLGAASLKLTISDAEGFTVRHGVSNEILMHLPPERCETGMWSKMVADMRAMVRRSFADEIIAIHEKGLPEDERRAAIDRVSAEFTALGNT